MALLIRSLLNSARLTTQVKHLFVPISKLNAVFSAPTSTYSSKLIATMIENQVVPDVIDVAPKDKIEVIFLTQITNVGAYSSMFF